MVDKTYYICHRSCYIADTAWLFWLTGACGYTFDINMAGLYSKNEYDYPVLNKDNICKVREYDDFYIHCDDIKLLDKAKIVVEK